ncbi:AzlC family ABC transporter permease [Streptomyces sp. NPDC050548]|uniref:AzlC family ABC transporter permease n=1 Tax=Streptomyces sp. NPDC050548 TaxID=3365629 RepID=UPI00379EE8D5
MGLDPLPVGLAFGVLVTHAGLPWWRASLFTSVVHAGSFDFLLVCLPVAVTPLATVALTAFLVNVRHVFYGPSFPLDRVRGRLARSCSAVVLPDEAYALTSGDRAGPGSVPASCGSNARGVLPGRGRHRRRPARFRRAG